MPNVIVLDGDNSKGKEIGKIDSWGPLFRISLDLIIHSRVNDVFSSVLAFKGNGNIRDCCEIGDRIPAIFTVKGGFIQVATNINNQGNRVKNVNLNEKTWYKFELMQYVQNNKVTMCVLKFLVYFIKIFLVFL